MKLGLTSLISDKYDDHIIANPMNALEAKNKKFLFLHVRRTHSILVKDLKGIEETNEEHNVKNDSDESDYEQ